MSGSEEPVARRGGARSGGEAAARPARDGPAGGESVTSWADATGAEKSDSPVDLTALLDRSPTEEERRAWAVLSPALRRRAVDRVMLLRRWWGERDGLTAGEAAAIAGVVPNRFYQMAAAWRREPGLSAVGAHAAAPVVRASRIHPLVNASLQANVVKVVAEGGDAPVEAMRRRLEQLVSDDLAVRSAAGAGGVETGLVIPSHTVVRAVVTRELNRIGEARLLGESIAMDCCPTTMRSPAGDPWTLFAIVDRGTLRVVGTSMGGLGNSVEGYALAARRALVALAPFGPGLEPWASRTRRVDMVVGADVAACDALIARYGQVEGAIDFKPVTRAKRFGSLLRRYVGERMGRIHLRPGWAASPPPMAEGEETFARWDALARADFEARDWNERRSLERGGEGGHRPPEELVALLRLVAGGEVDTRNFR